MLIERIIKPVGSFKHLRNIFLLISALMLVHSSFSQEYLVLGKPGKKKRITYYVGQEISFKVHEGKNIITGVITDLNDSSIVMGDQYVPYHRIKSVVDFNGYVLFKALSKGGKLMALTAFLFGSLDNIINRNTLRPDQATINVTAAGVILWVLFSPFKVRKYPINERRQLRYVNVNIH